MGLDRSTDRQTPTNTCFPPRLTYQEDFECVGDLPRQEVVEVGEVLPDCRHTGGWGGVGQRPVTEMRCAPPPR